jgi:hypothetical protein
MNQDDEGDRPDPLNGERNLRGPRDQALCMSLSATVHARGRPTHRRAQSLRIGHPQRGICFRSAEDRELRRKIVQKKKNIHLTVQ